jgi:hypothetical protein
MLLSGSFPLRDKNHVSSTEDCVEFLVAACVVAEMNGPRRMGAGSFDSTSLLET